MSIEETEQTTIQTYVRFWLPGAFFGEDYTRKVTGRSIEDITPLPCGTYAYEFYDVATTSIVYKGKRTVLDSKTINESGRFFPNAEVMTVEDVASKVPDSHILIDNMRGNQWSAVVLCRTGNFQPFETGDEVVALSEYDDFETHS